MFKTLLEFVLMPPDAGVVLALIAAAILFAAGFTMGSLTHGVSTLEAIWWGVRCAVAGGWIAFIPSAVWSVLR